MEEREFISKEFIAKFLPNNPIILEAGAHIGRDTIKMANLWPKSTIYAYEPVIELYQQLINNTKDYLNIKCYNLALSNNNCISILNVSSGRSTALSSLLKPVGGLALHPKTKFSQQEIETITLNQWSIKNNVNKIDFMWLDAQGSELNILKGATQILNSTKAILIEISLNERYQNEPKYNDILNFLNKYNFKAIAKDKEIHQKQNILFIK